MIQKKAKQRIDKLLVERALVSTRARAQAMIMAGVVLVDDSPVTKPGEMIALNAEIRLKEPESKYVSRGAFKLLEALDRFKISVEGKEALDVGASTGGFTEVLLERGAVRVHAIDVGTNQLAWKLRSDGRVVSRENYNARNFRPSDFSVEFDLLVMDVSFISIRLILPVIQKALKPGAELVVLYKPQFELGREWIGDGGIVTDPQKALEHLQDTLAWVETIGLRALGWTPSPIRGSDGNQEYLIHMKRDSFNAKLD